MVLDAQECMLRNCFQNNCRDGDAQLTVSIHSRLIATAITIAITSFNFIGDGASRRVFVGIMPGGEAPGLGRTVLSHPFPIVSKTGVNVTCCI
jgi:hypothetical protein